VVSDAEVVVLVEEGYLAVGRRLWCGLLLGWQRSMRAMELDLGTRRRLIVGRKAPDGPVHGAYSSVLVDNRQAIESHSTL